MNGKVCRSVLKSLFLALNITRYAEKTCHRITKVEKSGKIVANQGIWMETAE